MMRSNRGTAALEFALVLPIMVLISLGLIDLGRLFYSQAALDHTVQLYARCRVVSPATRDLRLDCPHVDCRWSYCSFPTLPFLEDAVISDPKPVGDLMEATGKLTLVPIILPSVLLTATYRFPR